MVERICGTSCGSHERKECKNENSTHLKVQKEMNVSVASPTSRIAIGDFHNAFIDEVKVSKPAL